MRLTRVLVCASLFVSACGQRSLADRGAGVQDKEMVKLLLDMKAGAQLLMSAC